MWEEFRSHCDSQYQMTSEFFSQSIHILLNIFWERRNSSARKIVPWKKHRKNVNFGPILKIYIFEMKIKNWIEWSTKMSKIWRKIWTRTYCKLLLLPFTCESQSGPEKPDDKRNIFTLWQEFRSQYWGKYRWIPLMDRFNNNSILF